jgi:hypothetical protein
MICMRLVSLAWIVSFRVTYLSPEWFIGTVYPPVGTLPTKPFPLVRISRNSGLARVPLRLVGRWALGLLLALFECARRNCPTQRVCSTECYP